MGLSISVGFLSEHYKNHDQNQINWFEKNMEIINESLIQRGFKIHQEPRELLDLKQHDFESIPYSFIYSLKRIYAHKAADSTWRALSVNVDFHSENDDLMIENEMQMLRSHLICHSDCDGFYLPVEFEDLIAIEYQKTNNKAMDICNKIKDVTNHNEDENISVCNENSYNENSNDLEENQQSTKNIEIIGSSYWLLEDLIFIAPALDIQLDKHYQLTDEEASRIQKLIEFNHILYKEYTIWLALYKATRLSLLHKTAIVFH